MNCISWLPECIGIKIILCVHAFKVTDSHIFLPGYWECLLANLVLPVLLLREGNGNPLQYSCLENTMDGGAWWAAVHGVARSQTRLRDLTLFFHFHVLEKEMATHSSVLAWRIPGMEEPDGLPSMGSHRVGHNWSDLAAAAAAAVLLLLLFLLSNFYVPTHHFTSCIKSITNHITFIL